MIRKMLVIAAAIAMPVSVIAISGVTAGAASKPPPDPAVTCSVSATVNFASPGISTPGSVHASKTSSTTTTAESFGGGCTGTAPANNIVSDGVKCTGSGMPSSNTACTAKKPTTYGYDSWSNFESTGTASIQKALKKLSFTIDGIAYSAKTTAASTIVGGACGSEAGFNVSGTISAPKNDKGQTFSLNACLGASTAAPGSAPLNSTSNFALNAFGPGTVASAQLDPATSTIHVS
jgi:hypothetical protein